MKYFFCSCHFLMATVFCFGQTTKFKGKVFSDSNNPLSFVSITASQNSIIKSFTKTDESGYFEILLQTNQKYILLFSSVGYSKKEIEINVNSSTNVGMYILVSNQKAEDTVRIIAKRPYYENNDTIFYNADSYKRNNENNLKDLLNNLPGIDINANGKIIVNGQTVDKVLIDGKDLTGENYEKIINNLSPHGIDQVQVLKKYRDPFSLSASVTGDTEVAINLTFKKKKLIPNAKFSLGVGLPIKFTEQKTDFLITTKKITGLCFGNWNTIGNTFQYIASPNDILGSYKPGAFSKLGNL